MGKDLTTDYWQLVHQLSLLGWYRVEQHASGTRRRMGWGFRAGHATDSAEGHPGKERWFATRSEKAAMRALLTELQHKQGSREAAPLTALHFREVAADQATGSASAG